MSVIRAGVAQCVWHVPLFTLVIYLLYIKKAVLFNKAPSFSKGNKWSQCQSRWAVQSSDLAPVCLNWRSWEMNRNIKKGNPRIWYKLNVSENVKDRTRLFNLFSHCCTHGWFVLLCLLFTCVGSMFPCTFGRILLCSRRPPTESLLVLGGPSASSLCSRRPPAGC